MQAAEQAVQEAGGGVDYLFVVGGFSGNAYLINQLASNIGCLSENGLLLSNNGGAAVLKGVLCLSRTLACVPTRQSARL